MLKSAVKNVLFTIMATALVGLTGMRTSFSGETSQTVRQSMENSRSAEEKACELINGKMECVEKKVEADK